ncbi:cytochrome-c peroxidase [Consotaella salsifontis]|uniref:Cytochrome c peroxidase n=1 Tax=Consotaella salsifontis TaxID=1365950 RepID=A0A1T4NM68_9HYPH|nr:cytochrome-c peroxidase [Consotaella salsifontis]SJZ80304.1 cytochrome c peroxidase [Consotaella salsifontis]
MTRLGVWFLGVGTGVLLAASGASADELRDQAKDLFPPVPAKVAHVRGQPVTSGQIDLGRMLFFDPRLSASHVISCNTCHNVGTGGADNVPTSIGHAWQQGPRNSPTVLNSVFNVAQFWDGRAADLREQAKGPVQAGVEMANTPDRVVATLKSMPAYEAAFEKAFPDAPDAVTFDNMALAIEAFETTLVTPNSRYDQFVQGDDHALNQEERRGLQVFIDSGCSGCHYSSNFGGQDYFPFGVVEKPGAEILPEKDKGRFSVTQTATDEYVFRAAPLRNVELTAPYFHSGQVWDLKQAVGVMATAQLGTEMPEGDIDAIVAFLKTLTGERPEIDYPVLPVSTEATPKPDFGSLPTK